VAWSFVGAQTRFTYSSGQPLSPAYEGWMPNADGTFTMYFGYMNSNWLQEFDVPIGPDNSIEPGGPDQGQPTHFYPRRNPFLFTIKVPKDLGSKELIWTLTANGKTEKAYASLKTDYQIDAQVISTEVGGDFGSLRDELRTNIPPKLEVQGEKRRAVRVGEAVALAVFAADPDKPAGPPRNASAGQSSERCQPDLSSTFVHRGVEWPGLAVFVDGLSRKGERRDVYAGSNENVDRHARLRQLAVVAADTPSRYRRRTTCGPRPARFAEPGTYVLRGVASDGSLFTYENITVTVTK
jgi:hypothetical protein